MELTAVVNTRNEAQNITRCLRSVSPYVDEIVIVDMESTDETIKKARQFTKRIFKHENVGYVEPARNFAISKALGAWIFLIDADEVIPESLGLKLRQLITGEYSYYRIARKNIIFGRWIEHSGWWPDYQIRLFKKSSVLWSNEIHSVPITEGKGTDLLSEEEWAFTHYNFATVEQFIERLNRYTTQEAQELISKNNPFEWQNIIKKPANEFLSRFFAWEGYNDGLHGLALSLLQAFSMLVVQLKLWQNEKFRAQEVSIFENTVEQGQKLEKDFAYWYRETKQKEAQGVNKTFLKLRAKMRL